MGIFRPFAVVLRVHTLPKPADKVYARQLDQGLTTLRGRNVTAANVLRFYRLRYSTQSHLSTHPISGGCPLHGVPQAFCNESSIG